MKPELCEQFSVRQTATGFLVETPFSYYDEDHIVVFADFQDDGLYRLSDNGEAAERLAFDGIDINTSRIAEWLSECQKIRGVQWDADDQELWMIVNEQILAKAIFTIAECAAQLQAMTVTRTTRVASDFKEQVVAILREASIETGVPIKLDVPILPGNHFTVDAYFLSKRPLAVIVAGSRERLLEAELIWSTAKREGDPTEVYAVVENHRAVGLKEAERAAYFTDKILPFKDYPARFAAAITAHLRDN